MHAFFTALVTYLACDGISEARVMSSTEVLFCARSYEAVKVSFLSNEERQALNEGPAARAAALQRGYRRFSDWKARNPKRVGELRQQVLNGLGG